MHERIGADCRLNTTNGHSVYSAKSAFKCSWINLNKWCTDYYCNSQTIPVSYNDKTSTVPPIHSTVLWSWWVDRWLCSPFDVDLSLISLRADDFFRCCSFLVFPLLPNLILILMVNYLVHFSFGSFDFKFELYLNSFNHRLWMLRRFFFT